MSDFLRDKRIFYVEDDVFNRSIVQTILERHGAQFQFDRWGKDQTINKLKAFLPLDLVLLDLMLPGDVSGYDVFHAIKSDVALDHLSVVIISAADPSIEMLKARRLGFDGYISKPVDVMTFPMQLKDFFEGKPLWISA